MVFIHGSNFQASVQYYNSVTICLQETHFCPSHTSNLSTFTANHLNGNRANKGTDILVKNHFCPSPFNFQTPQQAITVHLNLPSLSFTLWSVYFLLGVGPTAPADLTTLISLLSPSLILLDDFNTIYILGGISP